MNRKEIFVFAVVVMFLMSYAVFAEGEGPQHDNPGLNPDRPQGPVPTPGVVRTAEKSFVVKKYTGPAEPEVATKTNLDFPAPKKLATSNFASTLDGFKDALNAAEEDAFASLGFAVRGGASAPLNHGFGIWKEARAGPAGYSLISGDSRQQLIEAGRNYWSSTATKTIEQQPKAETKTEEKKPVETPKEPEIAPVTPKTILCGDCDAQTKTGVAFEIKGDVSVLNMAVCAAGASEKECRESPSCGVDKPCICESFLKNNCEVRCFNTKGKYYVTVEGFRGLFDSVDEKDPSEGGYDYVCPSVSTESLAKTKQNLLQLQGKISGIAAKVDLIKANVPDNDTAAAFQKYSDVFKKISDMIDAQIKSIDAVLASPTEEGIQQNQVKADDLKKDIVDMLKTLQ